MTAAETRYRQSWGLGPDKFDDICHAIKDGESIASVCRIYAVTERQYDAVFDWLAGDPLEAQ